MGTWLVTGAAGFIGSHTCRRLLAEGERVVGVDRLEPGATPGLRRARVAALAGHRAFSLELVDVADHDAVAAVTAAYRPEVVIHLAARTGVRGSIEQPLAYTQANVVGHVALLEACRRSDVGHVVYASSSSVYGDDATLPATEHEAAGTPISLYAATKRSCELLAHSYGQTHGLPTTGLRLFTVYGPWGRPDMAYFRFAEAILDGEAVEVYGDGSARRDFTYVDDAVEGLLRIAARPPRADRDHPVPWRVYNVGRGRQETVTRLVDLLEELLERPARRVHLPPAPGDAAATLADARSLAEATGFTPRVRLDEGLERFVAWLLAYRAGTLDVEAATRSQPAQQHDVMLG